ncbi:MAG: zinc-binding dehydrogenase [Dehalococcoidia bacterium]|jgi:2-desacetyl-2-hydroxyethyl bacteriochlorophyllide A dehydrogenase|nr:zinc-binding dehydrogenase [Dehalococcoidia bacterium]
MKTYQLTGSHKLEPADAPDPTVADGQVLLEIEHVSICGSDTHLRFEPVFPEEQYPFTPGMPCHEIAGTIVESRNPEYAVGQRAIVLTERNAAGEISSGGLAEYISTSRVIPLPDYGGTDEWIMCQPSGTVLYSARRWGTTDDKRIAVLGQGAIGLSFTMIAANQGAAEVIAIDLEDYRLAKSTEFGATGTINADKEDVVEALAEATGGKGVDVVVDASGDPDGINQAVNLVNRRGLIIGFSLVSTQTETTVFRHQEWMRKEVQVIPTGSAGSVDATSCIADMVALRDRGWMDPSRLTTHSHSWDEIPEAYDMYADRADGIIKTVISVK